MGKSKIKFIPVLFPIFKPQCASFHGLYTVAALNLLRKCNRAFNGNTEDKMKFKIHLKLCMALNKYKMLGNDDLMKISPLIFCFLLLQYSFAY